VSRNRARQNKGTFSTHSTQPSLGPRVSYLGTPAPAIPTGRRLSANPRNPTKPWSPKEGPGSGALLLGAVVLGTSRAALDGSAWRDGLGWNALQHRRPSRSRSAHLATRWREVLTMSRGLEISDAVCGQTRHSSGAQGRQDELHSSKGWSGGIRRAGALRFSVADEVEGKHGHVRPL
jgi:hypothetical protein